MARHKPEEPKPDRTGGPKEEEAIVEFMDAQEMEVELSKVKKQTTDGIARGCQHSTRPIKLVILLSLPHFPTFGRSRTRPAEFFIRFCHLLGFITAHFPTSGGSFSTFGLGVFVGKSLVAFCLLRFGW